MKSNAFTAWVGTVLLGTLLVGCSTPHRLPAVPEDKTDRAVVLGDADVRTWGDELTPGFTKALFAAGMVEIEALRAAMPPGQKTELPPAHFLAISGGGPDGAYGAGLLCGWTETGTRPEFKLVTGISTGALTAPFAFLGPKYDANLKRVYTSVRTRDIMKKRGILAAIYNDALADTKPLEDLLAKVLTDEMIDEIAAEYKKGRLLLIATTNLDESRPVMWNIGAIASKATPESKKLIRKILVASAAIPAAFPPVMINVEVDGKKYQEMHVDGGATAQLFLYPPSLNLKEQSQAVGLVRERKAYVIRNARLDARWASVERQTLSIAGRAVSALIQTQGVGDLYRVYITAKRDNVDYNLAYIPDTFNEKQVEDFDPIYMTKLFAVGFEAGKQGGKWEKTPPGLAE